MPPMLRHNTNPMVESVAGHHLRHENYKLHSCVPLRIGVGFLNRELVLDQAEGVIKGIDPWLMTKDCCPHWCGQTAVDVVHGLTHIGQHSQCACYCILIHALLLFEA